MNFVLVAGEASGDQLGAALINALKARFSDARFLGVGGPAMCEAGLEPWFGIESFSVNGFVEPLLKLPALVLKLWQLKKRTLKADPVCFIGIDFNVFNLLLEGQLKRAGVKTVHYVSPSVWAWRQGRIHRIKRNVDLMLCLFPFETEIYQRYGINVTCVGHPKARLLQQFEVQEDLAPTRGPELHLACLPGSRRSEVAMMMPLYGEVVSCLANQGYSVKVSIPAANARLASEIERWLSAAFKESEVVLSVGNAEAVMIEADCVLVNAGTAALEAMLLDKPMVVVYRVGWWTYQIVRSLVRLERFSLPNILSGHALVEEFIQDAAKPQPIADAIVRSLNEEAHKTRLKTFRLIREQLARPLDRHAVPAITALIEDRSA